MTGSQLPPTIRPIQLYRDASALSQVNSLITQASAVDNVAPISEQFLRGLAEPQLQHSQIIAQESGNIVGFAATDGTTTELVVQPSHRSQGVGSLLIDAAPTKEIWAHGNTVEAQGLAKSKSLTKVRELLVMEISGDNLAASARFTNPDGFVSSSLADSPLSPDETEKAWLEVNNEAFDWHPEQGGWDLDRLHVAERASWFREEDVLFLWKGKALAGFHWVKQHTPELFETYVMGLASAFRGQGLGDALVRLGLHHMVERGARRVILYVEADNKPAVKAYETRGFQPIESHVLYRK